MDNILRDSVESAITSIREGTSAAREVAKAARDRWHECLMGLDGTSERPAAIDLHLKYLVDRIEEESLPGDWH